jgi:hypothetical protein
MARSMRSLQPSGSGRSLMIAMTSRRMAVQSEGLTVSRRADFTSAWLPRSSSRNRRHSSHEAR